MVTKSFVQQVLNTYSFFTFRATKNSSCTFNPKQEISNEMDSTQSDRSLSGISLPQWMKTKISERYDLDQTTFSPPNEDDSFFYIRYPKAKSLEPSVNEPPAITQNNYSNYRSINEVLQNHTVPCREFIPQAKTTPHELGLRKAVDPPLGRIKSTGTDDGFTGEGAACGHSVVAVAHQMMSGKLNIHHKSASDDENTTSKNIKIPSVRIRRNSRSLPASPHSSPKLDRKNPYFTHVLLGSSEMLQKASEGNTSSGSVGGLIVPGKQGWLMNILGKRESMEELFSGCDDLPIIPDIEESLEPPIVNVQQKPAHSFKAKPSELREMNFWSPTSM